MIKFTLLLPIYQRNDLQDRFKLVMESILNNSLQPNQILICIDGALSDDFLQIVNSYKHLNYYEVHQFNKIGLSMILNHGIELSKNEWIVRADGDDINSLNRFFILSKYMAQNYDLIGSYVIDRDEKNNKDFIKKLPLDFNTIKAYAKYRNPFNHMSVAFKKSTVEKLNGYPHLFLKEDYGLWIKMINNNCKLINIPDKLVYVNANSDMYSRRGGFQYIKSEIELFKFKIKFNISNSIEAFLILIMRSAFIIFPNIFKIFLYKKFFRKNTQVNKSYF